VGPHYSGKRFGRDWQQTSVVLTKLGKYCTI
jgi:hypothetical protein